MTRFGVKRCDHRGCKKFRFAYGLCREHHYQLRVKPQKLAERRRQAAAFK